jgi:hypothetical protein
MKQSDNSVPLERNPSADFKSDGELKPTAKQYKRRCDQNIHETLLLVQQMIRLADEGDSHREDVGCGVLYGLLRDSAYKLQKIAEQEKMSHIRKGWWQICSK